MIGKDDLQGYKYMEGIWWYCNKPREKLEWFLMLVEPQEIFVAYLEHHSGRVAPGWVWDWCFITEQAALLHLD